MAAVKKKLYSTNPHQAMFALLTLESVVKNCGKYDLKKMSKKVPINRVRSIYIIFSE